MKTIILNYLWGVLKIQLTGYAPERFLNLCAISHIELWDIVFIRNKYYFNISVRDFKRTSKMVKKAHVHLKIMDKIGLPFLLYRNRRRKMCFIGMIVFAAAVYIDTLFLWNISFSGNIHNTKEVLTDYLNETNISCGMMKHKINCTEIEDAIREHFPDITWVSARVSGTRLLIKIKENEGYLKTEQEKNYFSDIIASDSGKITEMVVRSGISKVHIGDQVEKGQLLVEGLIPIVDDSENLVNSHETHSDADIYADTQMKIVNKIPKIKFLETETGKERKGIYLKIFDYSFVFLRPVLDKKSWKFKCDKQQLHILKNFYLPITVGLIEGKQYCIYEKRQTKNDVEKMSREIQSMNSENLLQKGVIIIENNVKIQESAACYKIIEELLVTKNIGEQKNR